MFQTEWILFLQSYSNEFLDSFFNLITNLGNISFIRPFLIAILFGISYKKGYVLIQLVIWNELATMFLKELFALPRPVNVDSRVRLLDKDYPNPTPLYDMGAKSFWGPFPEKAVAYIRTHRFDTFGFPSGHTSGAVSLFGSVSVYFRKQWIKTICITLILLIPLSRMYLGRHFLADVLGGYLVGSFFLFVFYRFLYQNKQLKQFIFKIKKNEKLDLKALIFISYSLAAPLLFLTIPHMNVQYSASLLGVNIGFFLVWFKGIPNDEGSLVVRLMRILLAFIVFTLSRIIIEQISGILFTRLTDLTEYIFESLIMLISIWGSVELNIKFKLYKRSQGSTSILDGTFP